MPRSIAACYLCKQGGAIQTSPLKKMPSALCKLQTKAAERHLCEVDTVMRQLVKKHGNCTLWRRVSPPFDALVCSIIGQQLSAYAARTIRTRVVAVVGAPFEPGAILKCDVSKLRAAGLSGAKVRYIRELADRVDSGQIRFGLLRSEDSPSVVAKLLQVPGVGKWTAEMFLIFGLRRPDVLASTDAGLQRAVRLLYGNSTNAQQQLERVANAWRPYRSVASWYLWRHLDSGL